LATAATARNAASLESMVAVVDVMVVDEYGKMDLDRWWLMKRMLSMM